MKRFFIILIGFLFISSCVTIPKNFGPGKIMPDSILVLPPMNNTVDMKAPDVVWPIVHYNITERGYQSPPIDTVKQVLEQHHIHYAGEINIYSPEELGKMFHVDAVLYTTITDWSTTWLALYASQTVGLQFVLKSAKDGQLLWENHYKQTERGLAFSPKQMTELAVGAALSPYTPLAKQVVGMAFARFPLGPYKK
jgi:hypothetical protein